ncbi:MAG: DUF3822 family protein [Tunicatimonas sp.]
MEHPIGYDLVRQVKDKEFSIDDLTHYDLLLLVGEGIFQLCVIDARTDTCVTVEEYAFPKGASPEPPDQAVAHLFEGHTYLMAGYWRSVRLAIRNSSFTLVPSPFFSNSKLSELLTHSAAADKTHDGYYYYAHTQSDAVMVFAAQKKLVERIRSFYPSLKVPVVHHGSALIEGIQSNRNFTYYRDMYLHVGQGKLSVVVTQDNNLVLYNQFQYAYTQDLVKYTRGVMQQLEMDPSENQVTLWGNIPERSPHFQTLYRYIKNIGYGGRPAFLKFSNAFDELPNYRLFDLYSLYVCEA